MDSRGLFADVMGASQMQAQHVFEQLSQTMEPNLRRLFDELDTNSDGAIQFDEFRGMTLNVWAAFYVLSTRSISRLDVARMSLAPLLQALPFPETRRWTWPQVFLVYVFVLFLVHCGLFVLDKLHNAACRLGLFKPQYRFPSPPLPPVVRVDKATALHYDTPMTWYETAKTAVMVLSGLMLLRLVMAVASFVFAVTALSYSSQVDHPLLRRFLQFLVYVGYRGLMFSLAYYTINQIGTAAPPSEVKVLCGNHVGVIEVAVMFIHQHFPSFVSRIENLSIPLFAGIVQAADAIVVNRDDGDSKTKTLREIQARAADPASPQIMIFPEGTCNNQKALFTFKKGAFVMGEPVQPVVFMIPYKHWNPCYTGRVSGGNDLVDIVFRTCCQFVNRLECKVLPVYKPSEAEKADPLLYAKNVQELMARSLGIGASDASYDDYRVLMRRAHDEQERAQERQKGGWFSKRSRRWRRASVGSHSDNPDAFDDDRDNRPRTDPRRRKRE